MKKTAIYLFALGTFSLAMISCNSGSGNKQTAASADSLAVEAAELPNTLTEAEKADGWQLIFNGTDYTGWRGYCKDAMPAAWIIEEGAMKIKGSGTGEAGAVDGGDIVYTQPFKNFDFKFEWKVSKGANSGIFYLAQEKKEQNIWKSSPEYQILDNALHPDAKLGKDGNRQSGSLYDLIPAVPQNFKGAEVWNTGEILVYKGTVIHYMNGEKVLEYHLWTDDWKALIDASKFKGWEDFINTGGANHEGLLGLQDHGDDVWYRSLKVKVME